MNNKILQTELLATIIINFVDLEFVSFSGENHQIHKLDLNVCFAE